MSYAIFRPLTSTASGSAGSTRIGDDASYSNFTPSAATIKGALTGINSALGTIIADYAKKDLSNLIATSINQNLVANANNKFLGSNAIPWLGAYVNALIATDGSNFPTLRTDTRILIDASNSPSMAWSGAWTNAPTAQTNKGVAFLNQFRLGNQADLNLLTGAIDGVDYVQIGKQTSVTPIYFNYPPDNGSPAYVLSTDGSGNTSWIPQSGGGGSFDPLDIQSDLITNPSLSPWNIKTFDQTTAPSSAIVFSSGSASGSDNSGNMLINSGSVVDGVSGSITLSPGSAIGTGTRGSIVFKDGSEGFAGYIWMSTDTSGTGTWTAFNPIPTGIANSLPYFDSFGNLNSNNSAKFNSTVNSMAFGLEGTPGSILSTGTGTLAHGGTDNSGATITVTGFGSQGFGGAISSGSITSNSASLGFGLADGASIATGGIGAFSAGYSKNSASILADGHGAFAIGYAINTSVIHAGSSDGAFARGMAQNSSTIVASARGSFASGFADSGGDILAGNFGAHSFGYTANTGTINSSGLGALAAGHADGAATILASGAGALAFGSVSTLNVTASGESSLAFGNELVASGQHSFAWGRGHNNDNFHAVIFGRYSIDPASSPTTWTSTDELFVLGNGASAGSRNNAFAVYKNGSAVHDGTLSLNSSLKMKGTTNYLTFFVPAGVSTYSVTWPAAQASGTQVLQNDGSGNLSWSTITAVTFKKETFTLNGTDISNGYVDLTHVAKTDSLAVFVKGAPPGIEGSGNDYTVSYSGGAGGNTRILFDTGFTVGPGALSSGEVVQVNYSY